MLDDEVNDVVVVDDIVDDDDDGIVKKTTIFEMSLKVLEDFNNRIVSHLAGIYTY